MLRTRCFPMAIIVSVVFMMTACAFDLAHIQYNPAHMNTPAIMENTFSLTEDVALTNLPCGYNRTIKNGTHWSCIGRIDAGDVYKSADQSLTIECSNVFEAYLVMKKGQLVGFYLPVQEGYVQLEKPVTISTQ